MITDTEGVEFLQWCLPRLNLRWPGFRKVRRQVYKRIHGRLRDLGLPSTVAYREYLESHPAEWSILDASCWISISRFYRDLSVFEHLERDLFPELAAAAGRRGESELRCWSAGCCGGEEPYSVAIAWHRSMARHAAPMRLKIIATDIDPHAIQRAQRGCYRAGSLKQMPAEWRHKAFIPHGEEFCLEEEFRQLVTFAVQDIRERMPEGEFHLILCRNLVFTYFDDRLQREITQRLIDKLIPGGRLIIGKLESLPEGPWPIEPWSELPGIYRGRA